MRTLHSRSEAAASGLAVPATSGQSAASVAQAKPAHDPACLFIAVAFAVYTALSLSGIAGRLLSITFPVGCALVGLLCYTRSPATYMGLTFWVWLLTPMVRRIYDLHYGFHPTSSILIAPLAISMIAGITVLRRMRMLRSSQYIPFMIAGAGLTYAYLIGLIRHAPVAATYDLITWIAPLLFGIHVALDWRQFARTRKTLTSCALWGLIVCSLYGIAQFVNPLSWDRAWVVNAEMVSVGAPLPFIIRVFSTLNAPGPFSIMLIFALIIGLAAPQKWRALPIAVGIIALMLTKGRSAWAAFLLALLIMQLRQPLRNLPRQWLVLGAVFLIALPLAVQPRVLQTFTNRAATLRKVEDDRSFKSRVVFTRIAVASLSQNPAGSGLGGLGGAAKLYLNTKGGVSLDSGPLEIYTTMGWLGGTLFMVSLLAIILPIVRARRVKFEPVTSAAVATVIALIFTSIFGNIFNSTSGFFFWTALGIATAGRTYAESARLLERLSQLPSPIAKLTALRASSAA